MGKQYICMSVGAMEQLLHSVDTPNGWMRIGRLLPLLAKTVCRILTEEYDLPEEAIVYPYLAPESFSQRDAGELFRSDNRFIFVKPQGFSTAEHLESLREKVLRCILSSCPEDGETVETALRRLMFLGAEFTAEHPLVEGGRMLDSLELSGSGTEPCPQTARRASDAGRLAGHAARPAGDVRGYRLLLHAKSDWGDRFLRDKTAVAEAKSGGEPPVESASLEDPSRVFLKRRSAYAAAVDKYIGICGGSTVYCNGDELIALFPKMDRRGVGLFDFVAELFDLTEKSFALCAEEMEICTHREPERSLRPFSGLSVAAVVFPERIPLDEALVRSGLLLSVAEKQGGCSLAISLERSGFASARVIVPRKAFANVFELRRCAAEQKQGAERAFATALHRLHVCEKFLPVAGDPAKNKKFLANTLKNGTACDDAFLLRVFPEIYSRFCAQTPIFGGNGEGFSSTVFSSLLQILRFLP